MKPTRLVVCLLSGYSLRIKVSDVLTRELLLGSLLSGERDEAEFVLGANKEARL